MSERETAAMVAAELLTADVLARIDRASESASRTYRLAKYGYETADVAAELRAQLWQSYALGERPNVSAVSIGKQAKRVADRIRRGAERETVGTADVADGMAERDGQLAADDGTRQRAAVMSKHGRSSVPKRTDVLAVADASRQDMRSAEDSYLSAETARRIAAELDREWQPSRRAEYDAWQTLRELAADVSVPSHGIGTAADVVIAPNGKRAEPMHGHLAKDTAGAIVGRSRVFVCTPSRERASRAERAELRSRERASRAELETAEREQKLAVAMADDARGLLAVAVAVARLTLSADVLADARESFAAVRLERETASRETAATVTADYRNETAAISVPTVSAADALLAGYVPEKLAERVSAKRAAAATVSGRFTPSVLATSAAPSVGRNWLRERGRSLSWVAAVPSASTATRAALQRAADAYGRSTLANVSASWLADAETAVYRHHSALEARENVARTAAPYKAMSAADMLADVATCRAEWGVDRTFSRIPRTVAVDETTAARRLAAEWGIDRTFSRIVPTHSLGRLSHVSRCNGEWWRSVSALSAIAAGYNARRPDLSTCDAIRAEIEAMRVK